MLKTHLQKESAGVAGMRISNTCKKMKLPNGKVVDILSTVFEEMEKWLQDASGKKEAGGYIVENQYFFQ